MENSSWSLSVYCRKWCSWSKPEKSSMLKCSGRNLGLMKLHGRWKIRCGLCILPYFSDDVNQFWLGVLVYVLAYALVYVLMILIYVHIYI